MQRYRKMVRACDGGYLAIGRLGAGYTAPEPQTVYAEAMMPIQTLAEGIMPYLTNEQMLRPYFFNPSERNDMSESQTVQPVWATTINAEWALGNALPDPEPIVRRNQAEFRPDEPAYAHWYEATPNVSIGGPAELPREDKVVAPEHPELEYILSILARMGKGLTPAIETALAAVTEKNAINKIIFGWDFTKEDTTEKEKVMAQATKLLEDRAKAQYKQW